MASLLRKVKSTINESSTNLHPSGKLTTRRSRLQKPQDRSDPSLDPSVNQSTVSVRQIQTDHRPPLLTEFRRRLARKASTFSLRTKRWQGELKESDSHGQAHAQADAQEVVKVPEDHIIVATEKNEKHLLLPRFELQKERKDLLDHKFDSEQRRHQLESERGDQSCASSSVTNVHPASLSDPVPFVKEAACQPNPGGPGPHTSQEHIRKRQAGYISVDAEGGKVSLKMASEHAQPPVPYTRLKEITESACETALSGITSYSHSDTEIWNTTIINNILGALVEETTPPGSGVSPVQPHFKYVVNSTIIQHAAASSTSSEEPKKVSGRRGMHAASGAFWNNEKDGMWSYKYPGADSKGLDVVIGIIWVWVG